MRNWDDLVGNEEVTNKPKIMVFIESFEKKHQGIMPKESLRETAIYATALYLFGPAEDEDLMIYVSAVKKRVEEYYQNLH